MRCKRHVTDLSSTVGVCASCLRERLLSIIAAQSSHQHQHNHHRARNQVHAQLLAAAASSLEHQQQQHHHRKSDFDRLHSLQAESVRFPRSVSPHVLRGKKLCDGDADEDFVAVPDRRFYSTPQIGQMASERERKHHSGGRFSFFSGLFKPRSDRSERPEFDFQLPHETKPSTSASTSSSFSWFSSIRRKHKSKAPKTSAVSERLPRRVVVMDRGMTPERMSCGDADEFEDSKFDFVSYSCKQTPARSVKPSSNISGMAFCMSPLVRASPARLWNQKSVPCDLIGFSGEIRSAGNHPHLSAASSYCANRSRKLVDFGRASHHH